MVKMPFMLLHPVPPAIVQLPVITPLLSVLLVVFNVPVIEVPVSVSVFPPDTTVNENENGGTTWSAELKLAFKVPLGLGPVTGKQPPSIWVRS
jgi:hypothetical protein